MKIIKMISSFMVCCLVLASVALYMGCEDNPSGGDIDSMFGNSVNLTPSSVADSKAGAITILPATPATITHIGQRLEFEAQGGHWPYTWSIANTSRGTIDVVQHDTDKEQFTAVYTVNEVAVNTIIVMDASGRTGSKELSAAYPGGPTLTIVPNSDWVITNAISTGVAYVLGGVPPYNWVTDDPTGAGLSIIANNGSNITWRADATAATGLGGIYYIFVLDAAEQYDEIKFTLQKP